MKPSTPARFTAAALRSQRKSKEGIGEKGFDANSVSVQIAHS